MNTSYGRPHPSLTKPGLSPLIAVVVLIVALVCLAAAEKKRRAPAKPAIKPVKPPPTPQQEYDEEAALIREHKRQLDINKSRRTTGAQLWQ